MKRYHDDASASRRTAQKPAPTPAPKPNKGDPCPLCGRKLIRDAKGVACSNRRCVYGLPPTCKRYKTIMNKR